MATKKAPAKKKAAAKKAPAKKAAAKKAPAKKAAKKAPAKKAAKKAAKPAKKRTPNAAFMRPMNIGEALHSIVGNKPIPRSEVIKRLWDYIKKNGLQDAKERRNINGDAALQKVFGGKKTVSMFEMAKHVSKHLS